MRVTVERMPGSVAEVDIFADDAEFSEAFNKAYRKIAREVAIPGFRKGKAPRHIIEGMIGRDAIVEQAGQDMMDDLFRRAIEQENLIPVGEPRVGILQPEPIGFKVVVEVYPEVKLGDYRSVRVEPREVEIEDSEVEEVVDQIQKSRATFEELETARQPMDGDQVILDYTVFEGEEQFQDPVEDAAFILGESGIFDSLSEAIKMMSPGTTAAVTLAFDEDDESVSPELRGKELSYEITLKEVKRRVLPERDDELATTAGDFETYDAMIEQIRKDLLRNKATQTRNEVVTEVINAIAETSEVEIPSTMVEKEIDDELTQFRSRLAQQRVTLEDYLAAENQSMEDLRDEIRPNAERRVRNTMVLQEVAKAEDLKVTDEDIAAEIDRLVVGMQDPDRMRGIYQSEHFRGLLENEIYDRKLTDLVVDIATEGQGAITGAGAEALKAAMEPPAPAEATESADDDAAVVDVESMAADTAPVDAGDDATEVSAEAIAEAEEVVEAEPAQPTTNEPPAEPVAAADIDAEETEDVQPA
ncbi:MAG TPA: trigger factor [Thermomicrobiales bacterium]|nr:trigger factor [Thermomicrobiales bacterium]